VIFREILGAGVERDGLRFNAGSVTAERIREPDEYHGVRVHLEATLDTARIRLQIDVGLGDVVTPRALSATLPAILEGFSKPEIRVYPPETIVSEKLHAMVKLGIANSRMKDFFDVYVLARGHEFEERLLAKAISRTFDRRNTAVPEEPFALTAEFYSDRAKETQWRAFLKKNGLDAPELFSEVGDLLRTFLVPPLSLARIGGGAQSHWRGEGWRDDS